ncbi:hypothetical protein G6F59_016126 [Rhizopus arrhizus]|nr:hypothetical protein G6F59_016126 [Rhizopus arrhizus]
MSPAYMTMTWSAMRATSPISWEMNTMPSPNSVWMSRSRSSSSACTVTSSAVVGSSAISSSGPHISAMAIITRWRRPPDNWCGYCVSRCPADAMPTFSSSSMARSRACCFVAWR